MADDAATIAQLEAETATLPVERDGLADEVRHLRVALAEGIVGYGGLAEARSARPALTTVDVDFHQQGWLAGVILTRAVKERSPAMGRQILLGTQFTVRQSSIVPTGARETPRTS